MKQITGRRGLLIAAVVVAAVVVFWPSASSDAGDMVDGDEVTVLTAGKYIPAFTILKSEQVVARSVPKNLVPPGALRSLAELKDSRGRSVYFTAVPIPAGQMMNHALLVEKGRSHGLSSMLEPGTVAVSISVDATHGAGGWIQPGDAVAVFISQLPTSKNPVQQTRLLFPLVHVLAVDHARLGGDAAVSRTPQDPELAAGVSEGNTLTVLLNPVQAKVLIESREGGTLTVVLRGLGDDQAWML